MRKRMLAVVTVVLTMALGGRLALAEQAVQPDADSNKKTASAPAATADQTTETTAQSAKRFGHPETVTGLITMVVHKEGILVLTLAAKTPSKTLSVDTQQYDSVEGGQTMHHRVTTTVKQSGDVDYAFRVTNATRIWIGGKRVGLGELRDVKSKPATIRFVPQASGDFAEVIEIH